MTTTADEIPSDKSISGYGSIPQELISPGVFGAIFMAAVVPFAATGHWIEGTLAALFGLSITVVTALDVRRTRRAMARLREVGFHTTAVITKLRWASGVTAYDITRWISYGYEAGGRERVGHRRFSIGWPFYRRVKVGDRIDILYDPADPDVSIWMD
jgi:hypothetical protein